MYCCLNQTHSREATKRIKLHPFSSLWTLKDATNYIRARWEIMLKDRLTYPFHVCQNRLPEVPTEKLISRSLGIIKRSLIEVLSRNTFLINTKAYNLVIVLS
jgi:hypothetical protein